MNPSLFNSTSLTTITTMSTTTSAQILHHTSAFISETLSRPDLHRHLSSTFIQTLPKTTLKPLTIASRTIGNAISTTSPSIRSSSLQLAENLIFSVPNNTFSSFLLSLVYYLRDKVVDASLSLLDVFVAKPSLSRLEIAPFLFQELFLIHFTPLIEWYNERRSNVLSSFSSSNDSTDDRSIVSNTTLFMSKMSGDQASGIKDLERDYEFLLDENCRIFAEYLKEVLRNNVGNDDQMMIVPPTIVVHKSGCDDKLVCSDEERIKIHEFESTNRRYNPIWEEEDRSNELSSNRSNKSLSKFPSFFPVRVSPNVMTNKTSSKKLEKISPNYDDFAANINLSTNDDLSDYSSSDSEMQQKENIKKVVLFNSKQSLPQKQKQPLLAKESSNSPDYNFMDGVENVAKRTPPKDFVCPITTHVFNDPVTLETGQTYERKAIQEWLDRGNSTCPITRHKLQSTHLPKTNYVLKRLIASWREQQSPSDQVLMEADNMHPVSPENELQDIHSVSPTSVISKANVDAAMSELRLAVNDLCTSEILRQSEMAVLKIDKLWNEANMEVEMQYMLAKPPVVNGFVEILFNSVDKQVLKATVLILTDLGSRDDNVIQTLTRVDSDVECIVELFKKGLEEAVVLVHLLRPSAMSLIEMDLESYLLAMLCETEEKKYSSRMYMKPKTACVVLLGHILRGTSEERLVHIVRSIVSTKAIEKIVVSLKGEQVEEKMSAVSVLLRCIMEDGKCRNVIAEKAELGPVVESFVGVNDEERFEIIHFLSELVKLNRRNLNEQIFHILKDEGTFSTMHMLLAYQQNTLMEHSPVVAGLLLQLDLLDEPRKMSIYREEAIDTLISCLRNSEFPAAQICAAETILSLQGRFSYSGKSLSRAILLKRAGLDRSYKAFMRKDQRRHNLSVDAHDTMEDEKSAEEWERKMAFVLVSHEFGLVFEALAEGLKSKDKELRSICFMTATWLVYMLSVLPDTGIRGAARVCLLDHFVSIFNSEKNIEDRALSMLALKTFIHDPEGLQDLSGHMKDILKGLRKLKKSSAMAFEMLKVFSEEHDNSADIWNHAELSREDCSINGEVLTLTCFKGKIFSGHSDGTIKVWTSRESELHLAQEIHEHTKAVTSLAVLHTSDKLYSGSLDRTVRVWSVSEEGIYCEQVHEMKDQINNLIVFNSIACYIPQGAGVKVHSWNGSSKLLNQNKHAKCLALVQGKLYCGCQDSSIQEIDLVTGTSGSIQSGSKKIIGKTYPIYAVQVHDGLIYAAGPSIDGANVKIWNTSNYSMVGSFASSLEIRTMVVSSELVYLGCKGGMIEVWCKKRHHRVETLQTNSTNKILCMALDDTNEDMLVIGTSDGTIQTWGLS